MSLKYSKEHEAFICPFCGGLLEKYHGDDVLLQIYNCEDCAKEIDSNGDEITDWDEFLIERG